MKIQHRLCVAFLLGCACLAGGKSYGQVMVDRVPADALLYAGWAGSEAPGGAADSYAASHLKGFIDALQLPQFLGERIAEDVQKKGEGERERIKLAQDWFATVLKSPTALYVGPFDIAATPDKPMPHITLFSKVGKEKAAAIAGKLDEMINSEKNATALPVGARAVGDYLMIFIGDDSFSARLQGEPAADALAGTEGFKAAMVQLGKQNPKPLAVVYADGEAIAKQIESFAMAQPAARQMAPAIIEGTGLNGFRQLAWAGGFDGPDWQESAFIGLKDRRNGLLAFFDNPALTDDAFRLIPQSATWAGVVRFDGQRLLADVNELAGALSDRGPQQLERGLQQFYYFTGVDLNHDLLPALGTEFVYYATPDVAGHSLPGMTLVNRLKDAKKAEKSLEAAETFINMLVLQRNPDSKLQFHTEPLPAPFDKVTAHVMRTSELSPAWAVVDDLFIFSMSVQGLQSALERAGGGGAAGGGDKPNIMQNPRFAALRKKLGQEKISSFSYLDMEKTAPETYALINRALTKAKAEFPETKMYVLPPLDKITPHLGPVMQVAWSDKDGFHLRQAGPFPAAGYVSPVQVLYLHWMKWVGDQRRTEGPQPGQPQQPTPGLP